jgi:hypothetical protein
MKYLIIFFLFYTSVLFSQVVEPTTGARTSRTLNGDIGYVMDNTSSQTNATSGYYLKVGSKLSVIKMNKDGIFEITSDDPIVITNGISLDADKPILRVPSYNQNTEATTIEQWIGWWYYSPPTITCNITAGSPFEIGTSILITISGSTVANGNILSNGILHSSGITPTLSPSFDDHASYSYQITFAPIKTPLVDYTNISYTFYATQSYVGTESGSVQSNSVTLSAVFPIFYGVSEVDYSTDPSGLYDSPLTKLVAAEGNKTIDLAGTGYIYFCFPITWNDKILSSILDHNGFENLSVFERFTPDPEVRSSGLTNNWTQLYVIYKYDHTVNGINYKNWQFIQ